LPEGEKCAASAKVRQAHAVAGLLRLDNEIIKRKKVRPSLLKYISTLNGRAEQLSEKEWVYKIYIHIQKNKKKTSQKSGAPK
jgi:hypothetical protein